MATNSPKRTIYQALFEAKQEMVQPKKKSKNDFFKSKYADHPEVMRAVMPALTNAGIVVVESIETTTCVENSVFHLDPVLVVGLVLASDPEHRITGRWPLKPVPDKNGVITPQAMGSALSYGRRYLLQTLTGVAAEDDDGNACSGNNKPPKLQQKPKQKTTEKLKTARETVNVALWEKLKERVKELGFGRNIFWDVVHREKPHIQKIKRIDDIIVSLTEKDFVELHNAFNAEFAAKDVRKTEGYDLNTGECYDRTPGGDEREGQ